MATVINLDNASVLTDPDWKIYCDKIELSPELQVIQNVMHIVFMDHENIRVSRMDGNKIVFYHHYDGELHVKEIYPEDLITKICKVWADLRGVMCFINWNLEPNDIFKRIDYINTTTTYAELHKEGDAYKNIYEGNVYIGEKVVPEWGITPYEALKYLVDRMHK